MLGPDQLERDFRHAQAKRRLRQTTMGLVGAGAAATLSAIVGLAADGDCQGDCFARRLQIGSAVGVALVPLSLAGTVQAIGRRRGEVGRFGVTYAWTWVGVALASLVALPVAFDHDNPRLQRTLLPLSVVPMLVFPVFGFERSVDSVRTQVTVGGAQANAELTVPF